jgi:hypothetical protein
MHRSRWLAVLGMLTLAGRLPAQPAFFAKHCHQCHDAETKKGGLDLTSLKLEPSKAENVARWVKIHDRIEAGEMPPKKAPPRAETVAALQGLHDTLVKAERARNAGEGRTPLRRLTRGEFENTLRDLLHLPGLLVQGDLPADGSAHGFDNNADALDISHVNMARYIEAVDRALDMAIATRPRAPVPVKQRLSLATSYIAGVVLAHGDAVLLKNKQPDPDFPPAGAQQHLDQGAHERMGSYRRGSTFGLFRTEDESFSPAFTDFVAIYPGRYRVTTSFWSFQWDKGKVLPARGTEAARLSIVQVTGDGRGGGHPSVVLGYYDAPSLQEKIHDFTTWLNPREMFGFNAASLVAGFNGGGNRAMGFTGPGIACDYLDIEGPLHETWPPPSHKALFGDLPIVELRPGHLKGVTTPRRRVESQEIGMARNRPDPIPGIWTVASEQPLVDADRLLAQFLPRAFRRPVDAAVRKLYVARVGERLQAGDCFETAMRAAYRAALISPDFLYRLEPAGKLDDHALACRLSYFLGNSMPDGELTQLADAGKLRGALREQTERLLADTKSQRFIDDFLGQWLKLRQIAATDPDRKLYPEFNLYLQDSSVAESRAYFRELLDKDLDARSFVQSDFAMLNEKLAVHYGIPGVSGTQIRRVPLAADSLRGPFLTQASILRLTANGTTTSPVPRGAFVLARLLGQPPEPPPANVAAIEPDVRGTKTIREQLEKHRDHVACAGCHAKIDPPGFALESFDVIGGFRTRYRSIGAGDPAPRGSIDPMIGIAFKLGPTVVPSGITPEGQPFTDIAAYQKLLAGRPDRLAKNIAQQLAVYATGRPISFADRDEIAAIVERSGQRGGGLRTLLHELIQSSLFQTR